MKKKLLTLCALCAALAAVPMSTLAQTTPPHPGMTATPPTALNLICRNAAPNEKPTGTIGEQPVVCKSTQAALVCPMMKAPKTTDLDDPQINQAWRDWWSLYQILYVRSGDG